MYNYVRLQCVLNFLRLVNFFAVIINLPLNFDSNAYCCF